MLFTPSESAAKRSRLYVYTEHFPPYTVVTNDKEVSGSAVFTVKSALRMAGFEASIDIIPWARAYEMALTQPNTILFSMAKTQKREPLFHWLFKLTTLKYDFYTRGNTSLELNSMEQALLYTTVAIRGSYEESKLRSLGFEVGKNLVLVADMASAWQMLDKGRVDTMFASHTPTQQTDGKPANQYKRQSAINDTHELFVVASLTTSKKTIASLKRAFALLESDKE
nr:transporter substrate-binding domain-containing protein [Pseudoalteromonas sp. S16_S37]